MNEQDQNRIYKIITCDDERKAKEARAKARQEKRNKQRPEDDQR